jgi:D-3-phosphoglycerate dehydrogenase
MKALLLENIHEEAAKHLRNSGFEVETAQKAYSEEELIAALDGVTVLGIRSKTQVTEKVLEAAPDLIAIGAFCIGTDQINIAAASTRGIAIFNAPYSNTRSVVELAVSELIALARRLPEKTEQMHQGIWNKSADGAHEIRGRTLGIVGYGNIGSQLSVLAEALGMRVVFYDAVDKLALGNAKRCVSLNELLEVSDIVSLHVDGRSSNRSFFGKEEFDRMKPGSIFLNLCRGFVIDHDSLRDHIVSGHITGAAVDVFLDEPASKAQEFNSPLRGLPNVILTPHIGGSTEEAQADIGRFVSGKLVDYSKEGITNLSINLPELTPERLGDGHRLAHLHKNIPGVLAEINGLLAQHGTNVDAQSLSTRGELGFALTDVTDDYETDVIEKLQALAATVNLRVIR